MVSDMGTEMSPSNQPCAVDMYLSNLRGQREDLRQHLKADKFCFPLGHYSPRDESDSGQSAEGSSHEASYRSDLGEGRMRAGSEGCRVH